MSGEPPSPKARPRLRIGELSRRTGVSPDALRAWERRYGLLDPARSDGGFRLYDDADERRVRAMKALIETGASAGEAARMAREGASPGGAAPVAPDGEIGALVDALARFDEPAANTILDDAVAGLTAEAVSERMLLPAMREIGERWLAGEVSIAQEHFATGVLRGRMVALARNWGAGVGPRALLACPSGEHHDFGLLAFGVALRGRGWRIAFLGADTPIETISRAAAELRPEVVVLAAMTAEPLAAAADEVSALARDRTVLIGGAGASAELARAVGALELPADPARAAETASAAQSP